MSINHDEWEKFAGGPTPANKNRIHVTLNAKGKIYLNKNTHRILGRPEAVLLYFNRKKETIGIRPAHSRLAEAFPVREQGSYYCVYAGPFCRHFGIKLNSTERFVRPDLNDEGVFLLDLATTVTVSIRRKRRK